MKILSTLFDFVASKGGMDKGDATSGGVVGGGLLAIVLMFFVTNHQYERDIDRMTLENSKLWHQVHVMRDTLAQYHQIYIPNTEDDLLVITNK